MTDVTDHWKGGKMPPCDGRFQLIDRVFGQLDDRSTRGSAGFATPQEHLLYLVWSALGIIENGSFQYFFENGIDALAVANSLEGLNLPHVASYFREAHSIFAEACRLGGWDAQLAILQQRQITLDELARKVLGSGEEIEERLVELIAGYPDLKRLAEH